MEIIQPWLNNTVGTASIKNAFIEKNTSIDDGLVQYNDPIEISFTGARANAGSIYYEVDVSELDEFGDTSK